VTGLFRTAGAREDAWLALQTLCALRRCFGQGRSGVEATLDIGPVAATGELLSRLTEHRARSFVVALGAT
jgi:hypothetical protein